MSGITVAGGFVLDDTVLLDNRVMRRAPGGNLLYSAAGAKLWSDEVFLSGVLGCDYPEDILQKLNDAGLNTDYMYRSDTPCMKVWALHELNGGRQLLYQLDSGTNEQSDPRPEYVPDELLRKTGTIHICAIPPESQLPLVKKFKDAGSKVTLDVIYIPGRIDPTPYRDITNLAGVDAFLPSAEEVSFIKGRVMPRLAIENWMSEDPGRTYVIKVGSDGCLVGSGGKIHHIPAYTTNAVDTTGAGDTFCGGFAAGLEKTGEPVEAAVMGCVSASFAVEDFGGVHILSAKKEEINKRFEIVRNNVEEI